MGKLGVNRESIYATPEEPLIVGPAGDIGRTALKQLIENDITPAGVVLRGQRLESRKARQQTADEIAKNFTPNGEEPVLDGVEVTKTTLTVAGREIPVVTPESQSELLQEGHPVIEASGSMKSRQSLEDLLEAGASSVTITSPIHEKEGIPAIVYGVNGTAENFQKAEEERLLSTSSCTTTAVTSVLGPLVKNDKLGVKEALVNVSHARTKSNKPWKTIEDNIILSSSGAVKEIPKILDVKKEELAFDLSCIRANASCGSMFDLRVRMNPEEGHSEDILREEIMHSLCESESVFAIEDDINETKQVIGRQESVVINSSQITISHMPDGSVVARIIGFYDNVHGYTRSMLDSFARLTTNEKTNNESSGLTELAAA